MLWWTLRQLKSEDWKEREQAARKLAELKEARTIEPLIEALKDRNAHVRHAIEDALVSIGDAAVPPLVNVLRDRNPDIRRAAESVLVKMGRSAVEPLSASLGDAHFEVREAAAAVLARIKDPSAIEQLLEVVKRGDRSAKEAAVTGLVRAGQHAVKPLAATLKENLPGIRETAAAALVRIGPKAVESLVAMLHDSEAREAALQALDQIDPNWAHSPAALAAAPALVASLKHKNERLRRSAAVVLGRFADPRFIEPLAACADDPDEGVQEAVATALGNCADARAVQALVRIACKGSLKSRRAAADALVQLGSAAVAPLVEALKDRNGSVREAIAGALVRVGHSLMEPLVDALWKIDPEWTKSEAAKEGTPQFVAAVKENAAGARETREPARKAGPGRVVKPLVAALKAKEAIVRRETMPTIDLGNLADVQAISATLDDPDPDVRLAATKRLLQMVSGLGEPLLVALKHNSHTVRRAAAHALAEVGDARGRDVLRSDLADTSDIVVLDAAESLVKLGDVAVVQPLLKLLSNLDEAVSQTDAATHHKRERLIRLLYRVVEQNGREIAVDDLRTIAKLHEREAKFVASTELRPQGAGVSAGAETSTEAVLGFQLSDLARQELGRRVPTR